jgi:hypothetical protein
MYGPAIGDLVLHRCPSMHPPFYHAERYARVVAVHGGSVDLMRADGQGYFTLPAYGQRRVSSTNPYGYLLIDEE